MLLISLILVSFYFLLNKIFFFCMVKSWYDIIVANAALLKIYTTTSIAPDAEVMTRQKVLEKKKTAGD